MTDEAWLMDARLFERAWPDLSHDLLLQAALLPEEPARTAWLEWSSRYDIEKAGWSEVRLLAAVAKRISLLDPTSPSLSRVLGIRRFVWTQSQMCLGAARPLLLSLSEAGVPLLLMKGAARHATNPDSAADRLLRDIDVLVPVERSAEAVDHALARGWILEEWQPNQREREPIAGHHAWSLRLGKGEVDLHHFSNYLNRLTGDDDPLWRRAHSGSLQGVPVLLPSPEDALLLSTVHGVRYAVQGGADWAIDAAALIDANRIDWRSFIDEAVRRRVKAPLRAGLSYLKQRLRRPIPDGVLAELRPREPFVTEFASYVCEHVAAGPRHVPAAREAASIRAVEAAKRRGVAVRIADPSVAAQVFSGTVDVSAAQARRHLCVPIPTGLNMSDVLWLSLSVTFAAAPAAPVTILVRGGGLPVVHFDNLSSRDETSRTIQTEIPAALLLLRRITAFWIQISSPISTDNAGPICRLVIRLLQAK